LEDIALYGIEEVYSAIEGDLIKPLQIEEGAVIGKGSILPQTGNFLNVILAPLLVLFSEDEVSDHIAAITVAGERCGCLEESIDQFGSEAVIDDAFDDLGSLDGGELCLFEPVGVPGGAGGSDIEEADEVSELHAFVVLLEQALVGLGPGGDQHHQVVIVIVDLMQILEVPV
jgi:hypothetical protein